MEDKMEIADLIERFEQNKDAYKSSQYNETQLRREFLDPFLEALGWDVENKSGYAEVYKDVVHEDAIKIGGVTKAPDYSFRIGGTRKFFVEAKKPAIHIKEDIDSAFQLRRYAWSAKLPLSILTNFEEFAIYDCRIKPDKTDKAATGRILYLTYKEYIQRWEEIASIFSREAVLKGAFDKFAEQSKLKKGTAEVDAAFLKEIELWRDMFARNLALRNPQLNQRELNFLVQATIDRIIFLRICEDRGIEDYGRLLALLNGINVYERLCQLFRQADERYNSGLFHFREERGRPEPPDGLTLNLTIDDRVIKEIIKNLYYPDSPYEFSVISADILGQVYEQFLGKVIQLTTGHRAVIDYKPEVKKAGGIYYTPRYIVDYIVKNTIGKLLEGKTPKQVANLKILDPACGSGSFLIGAYQYLLDWHRDWYVAHTPERWVKGRSPALYQAFGGNWRLTTTERKRILLNNIYGVDIDMQAVEVTKLSLLLKVLEGETEQSISQQLILFHERALPDLGSNIKCGNSLIGPDFYEGKQMSLFEDEERYRINVFDWKKEFPEIMKSGGFDAVIGNPPYGYMILQIEQDYFATHYKHQDYQKDWYLLFLERYEMLLKSAGLLGVIVSNTWLQSVTFQSIRKYLSNNYSWLRILHLPEKAFKAVVDTHVLIFKKPSGKPTRTEFVEIDIRKNNEINLWHKIPFHFIPKNGEPINIVTSFEPQILFRKIREHSKKLSEVCDVFNGVKPFEKGKGFPPQTEKTMKEKPFVKESEMPGNEWMPLLRGSLIERYANRWDKNYWILYGHWLAAPRDKSIFDVPLKIMVRQTGDSIIGTLIEKGFIGRDNLHIIIPRDNEYHLCYVLGIINSKLIDFFYTIMNPEKGEALAQVKKNHVEELPIHAINFLDPSDVSRHDRIVTLVEQMLALHKQLAEAKTPHDKTNLQRQIDATDRQIDRLVYELYGLTEEEIAIVEKP
jgi:type I restriction-modification system DNA methylase subunit